MGCVLLCRGRKKEDREDGGVGGFVGKVEVIGK